MAPKIVALCMTFTAISSSIVSPSRSVTPTLQPTAAPVSVAASPSSINSEGSACIAIANAMPQLYSLTGN